MGTWRVEGDDRTKRLSVVVDDVSPRQVAEGLRVALMTVYSEGGILGDVTEDDLTAVNIAFHESTMAVKRAERRRVHYLYWYVLPAVAINLGAAAYNLGRALGWW